MPLKAALLCVLLAALPAVAVAEAPPPEVASALPSATQRGSGKLSFLWYDAYKATLWTGGAYGDAWSPDAPYALTLTYDMDFSADDLIDRSITEMRRAYSKEAVEAVKADLSRAMTDVKAGDRLTGIFTPPATSRFYHNGQLVHTVTNADFAPMFFGIWLGAKTSEPALRAALLAESGR